jgi:hypothetical protein
MVKKIYLDGCSFTYGVGIDKNQSLEQLFINQGQYDVINYSRPGKSNLAIAMDTYKNLSNCDIAILGFTFSSRFYLNTHNTDIDFLSSKQHLETTNKLNGDQLELAYQEFHKYFYTLYQTPFCDQFSDFLIDGLCSYVLSQGKKLVCYSWEPRTTQYPLLYPYFSPKMYQPDRHLNAAGTQHLYDILQREIETRYLDEM